MHLSIIAENFTKSPFIIPEYGISVHIASKGKSILMDTAQGNSFFSNAETMGIDLKKLDLLALSHGHFDHVGGVGPLYTYHGPMPIWAHPDVEARHSRVVDGKAHFIGCHINMSAIDFRPIVGHVEIAPGFWGIEVPGERRDPEFMKNPSHLVQDGPDGWIPDPFDDDLSFVAEGEKGLCVILGCAHSGVVNILEEIARIFGTRKFSTVVGGMHMSGQTEPYIEKVTTAMSENFKVDQWLPCHCTGFKAAASLAIKGENVDWGYAGTSIEI